MAVWLSDAAFGEALTFKNCIGRQGPARQVKLHILCSSCIGAVGLPGWIKHTGPCALEGHMAMLL